MKDSGKTPAPSNLGNNLQDFRAVQLEFAAHIRNPAQNPKPGDVEERRMRVYRELVYNNIEGFLAGAFPIAKKLLDGGGGVTDAQDSGAPSTASSDPSAWHQLVRQFVHQHPSASPYFLEVSQEFLEFLGQTKPAGLPPFFLELCHYEWVELALRVDERDIPSTLEQAGQQLPIDEQGDLMTGCPMVSPLTKSLAYSFAVHRIRADASPSSIEPKATYLVVYRDTQDQVRFLEINAMTSALLELLDGKRTGASALTELAANLGAPELESKILAQGGQTLEGLRERNIVLGTLVASAS